MIDAADEARAEAWLDSMGICHLMLPETRAAMKTAYLTGLAAERRRGRRLVLSMAKRIAAQSEKLTRKARK